MNGEFDPSRPTASRLARSALWASLSGVVLMMSFGPIGVGPLVLVALTPLFATVAERPLSQRAALGLICGIVAIGGAFHWVYLTIARSQQIDLSAALPFFVLFVMAHALPFALLATAAGGGSPLRTASVWVLLEACWPQVFPWSLADALAATSLLRQGAELCGPLGLSWVVVLCNGLAAQAVAAADRRRQQRGGLRVLAVLAVLVSYGLFERMFPQVEVTGSVDVAVLQGQLVTGRVDVERANAEAWHAYAALTAEAVAREGRERSPDLVIWPETTLRVYLRDDDEVRRDVRALVDKAGVPLLLGALDLPADRTTEWNTAYVVTPGREQLQGYRKRFLLPFGEYVPGAESWPFSLRWRTTGRFVADGDGESSVMDVAMRSPRDTRSVRLAPSICLEALRRGVFNPAVRGGAEVLINLTDDGWFDSTWEPSQHLNGVRLRAVETRRWLVRASNSGISAFVSPEGEVVASLPVGARGNLRRVVTPQTQLTWYVRLGDWPLGLCAIHLATVALYRGTTLLLRRAGRPARRRC